MGTTGNVSHHTPNGQPPLLGELRPDVDVPAPIRLGHWGPLMAGPRWAVRTALLVSPVWLGNIMLMLVLPGGTRRERDWDSHFLKG